MPESGNPNGELRHNTEVYLAERQQWLGDAAAVLFGDRGVELAEALSPATEVRREAEAMVLTPGQERALREVAGRFGIGGEQDVSSEADYQLIEGGLAWKIAAEGDIANASTSFIRAGSPGRIIERDDEKLWLKQRFGTKAAAIETEYDIQRSLASQEEGFVPFEEDQVLPFSYKVVEGKCVAGDEATGQFVQIGTKNGKPVVLLRVDRILPGEKDGQPITRNPDGAELMAVIADILTATGDETASVGLLTSNTYASRSIDAVRAGMARNRHFDVGMYGRNTLMGTGAPLPKVTEINQIPGELHTIASKLQLLRSDLQG